MTTENAYESLCRLLGAWVNGTAAGEAPPDFDALFAAADRHLLSAAACFALEHAGLMDACPPETARRFRERKVQSVRRTVLMDAERRELLAFLEQAGIWYLPLKGVVMNGLWPALGARQFADNDILFDETRAKEVRAYMRRRGYKEDANRRSAHISYLKPPVYNFEMHRRLFMDDGKGGVLSACAAYYGDVRPRLIKDGGSGCGYRFSDEDFYVFFLAHTYKHCSAGGAGLRTLLDVYLYWRARPDMDGAYIAGELEKLALTEFEARIRALGEKLFGPPPMGALTGDEREMLGWMESSGTYGTQAHRVESEVRALQQKEDLTGRRARAKYLFRKFFPDMDWYRTHAPFCAKHRWAIPAVWVGRLFRGVFFRGRRNLRMLKTLCTAPDGKNIFAWAAEKARARLRRRTQRPVGQWPEEQRIAKAMRGYARLEGHTFDLDHPRLFTEKRLWYGLFFEHPDLTRIYDKFLFKGYIEEKLGPGHTAPLYGMWTDMRTFKRDWDSLPDSFCLKSNCCSLGRNVVFVRDKKSADKKALFREVKKWLDPLNTGINSWLKAYAGITPRIIAEKLLAGRGGQMYDYKLLCFGGKPDHFMGTADRFPLERNELSYTYYDLAWDKLPVTTPGYHNRDIPRPEGLEVMIDLAEKLSKGFPFVRVDFYDTTEGVILGEMTLYPSPDYDQKEWDAKLGEKFILPE